MCNEVARRIALHIMREDFSQLKIPLLFPEGLPNLPDTDSVRITDRTAIVRAAKGGAELVMRPWSWRGPLGRPVYNYRSDGRSLNFGRCLVPVDAFYEFTTSADPKSKRKDKWAFRHARDPWFCIGAIVRREGDAEAFAMLTTEPGADVAPYHSRQMVVVERGQWAGWLDGTLAASTICRSLSAGTLTVLPVANNSQAQR